MVGWSRPRSGSAAPRPFCHPGALWSHGWLPACRRRRCTASDLAILIAGRRMMTDPACAAHVGRPVPTTTLLPAPPTTAQQPPPSSKALAVAAHECAGPAPARGTRRRRYPIPSRAPPTATATATLPLDLKPKRTGPARTSSSGSYRLAGRREARDRPAVTRFVRVRSGYPAGTAQGRIIISSHEDTRRVPILHYGPWGTQGHRHNRYSAKPRGADL